MPLSSAFASELTWPEYEAAVRGGQTPILIPIGSMEQHGHHMPLHVDVLLPTEFARRVALEINRACRSTFHLRLQITSEVWRRQPYAGHDQP